MQELSDPSNTLVDMLASFEIEPRGQFSAAKQTVQRERLAITLAGIRTSTLFPKPAITTVAAEAIPQFLSR